MSESAAGGPAILVEGLQKSFGPVNALRGVDLAVPRGTVLGVLGPNGAGKTTAVRIMTTLLKPDAGRVLIEGRDVVRDDTAVREIIGLAGQSAAIQEELTGRENLEIVGRLYHLPKATCRERAEALLDRFDLADAADRPAKTYSGGMQRRLDLAASLVAEPAVLFLDEPTTGLDPRSRIGMWDVIRELVAGGTTLLLTTQYLDEADELADEIVVIDHGLVIAAGTSEQLKDRVGGDVVEFTVPDRARLADATRAVSAHHRRRTQPARADRAGEHPGRAQRLRGAGAGGAQPGRRGHRSPRPGPAPAVARRRVPRHHRPRGRRRRTGHRQTGPGEPEPGPGPDRHRHDRGQLTVASTVLAGPASPARSANRPCPPASTGWWSIR